MESLSKEPSLSEQSKNISYYDYSASVWSETGTPSDGEGPSAAWDLQLETYRSAPLMNLLFICRYVTENCSSALSV